MLEVASRAQVDIGSTSITFLPDGEVHLEPAVLFPPSGEGGWGAYAPYLDGDGRLPVSVGSFLIHTGQHRVLVDLGLGAVDFEVPGLGAFRGGRLLDSLKDEGLTPADIDTVIFTHLHHDHVGWTSDVAPAPDAGARQANGLTFGSARHVVDENEWAFWKGTAEITGPGPDAVQKPLSEIIEFLAPGQDVVPGVQALPTPGHTPGHTSVLVSDPASDERLLILGDVMHTQAQVAETHWNFLFDVDAGRGTKTRIDVLDRYHDENTLIAAGHFAGTVFGRFLPPRDSYRWTVSTGR
jgi:glyoxylase-like metal-dependent hydrolase (beta-lactamase superfamily II)